MFSTAQSGDIKNRGYVEVRSTLPAKVNGDNLRGSWPAIWMLGTGNGHEWPHHGEIDIVEMVNGVPKVNESNAAYKIFSIIELDLHDPALNKP